MKKQQLISLLTKYEATLSENVVLTHEERSVLVQLKELCNKTEEGVDVDSVAMLDCFYVNKGSISDCSDALKNVYKACQHSVLEDLRITLNSYVNKIDLDFNNANNRGFLRDLCYLQKSDVLTPGNAAKIFEHQNPAAMATALVVLQQSMHSKFDKFSENYPGMLERLNTESHPDVLARIFAKTISDREFPLRVFMELLPANSGAEQIQAYETLLTKQSLNMRPTPEYADYLKTLHPDKIVEICKQVVMSRPSTLTAFQEVVSKVIAAPVKTAAEAAAPRAPIRDGVAQILKQYNTDKGLWRKVTTIDPDPIVALRAAYDSAVLGKKEMDPVVVLQSFSSNSIGMGRITTAAKNSCVELCISKLSPALQMLFRNNLLNNKDALALVQQAHGQGQDRDMNMAVILSSLKRQNLLDNKEVMALVRTHANSEKMVKAIINLEKAEVRFEQQEIWVALTKAKDPALLAGSLITLNKAGVPITQDMLTSLHNQEHTPQRVPLLTSAFVGMHRMGCLTPANIATISEKNSDFYKAFNEAVEERFTKGTKTGGDPQEQFNAIVDRVKASVGTRIAVAKGGALPRGAAAVAFDFGHHAERASPQPGAAEENIMLKTIQPGSARK